MNVIKEYAKALVAALVGVLVNTIINLANGSTPWPHTGGEWVQFLVAAFGPAVAAVLVPNKISDKQVAADPTVVRVDPPAEVGSASISVGTIKVNPRQYRTPWS